MRACVRGGTAELVYSAAEPCLNSSFMLSASHLVYSPSTGLDPVTTEVSQSFSVSKSRGVLGEGFSSSGFGGSVLTAPPAGHKWSSF